MGNSRNRFIPRRLSFVEDGGAGAGTGGATAAPPTAAAPTAAAPASEAPTGSTPVGTGAPATTPGGANTQEALKGAGGTPEEVSALPKWAQDHIATLRNESASRRVASQDAAEKARAEIAQTIGKALGLVEDEKVDPALLASTVEQQAAELTDTKRALAVHAVSSTLGANPVALLDSRAFEQSISKIDPSDTKSLAAAVKEAVDKDPRFKATQAVSKSGGDLSGGSGEQRQSKPTTLEGAVGAYYGS